MSKVIPGVNDCKHVWQWIGMSRIKCVKCLEVESGHAREASGSHWCLTCNDNHGNA